MNDMDDRISAALHAAVDGLREQDLRPATPPIEERTRRQTIRWLAPLLTAAAVAAAIVTTFALTSSPSASLKQQQPGGGSPSPAPTTASVTPFGPGDRALPLWPFATADQAVQWENVDGPNGHSPWHADAKATALSFAIGYLQFHDITEVTSSDIRTAQASIGVGYDLPSGDKHTASVIDLVRYGDENAPWEVVGATSTDFSITQPGYGDDVTSPMTVAGRITGVDESIAVTVRTWSGGVDKMDPVPAGGENAPWSVTVPFTEHGVLSIIASTGGHLTAHERFAVVGINAD
jgi:hypothetical protein